MKDKLPLTPGRRLALMIGVPLAVLTLGYQSLSLVAWAGQGSFPVRLSIPVPAGGQTATISVSSGSISLNAGLGPRLGVTGTAHYAIFRSRVTWGRTADGASVSGQCRQLTGPCWFDLAFAVPAGMRVRAADTSGDVSATGLTGNLSLSSVSGNVALNSVSGDIGVFAQSGTVTGADVAGSRLTVNDESGTISLSGLAVPQVTVSDASGDITLTFTAVPDTVTVDGLSGNITLVLPKGSAAYSVNATASSGTTFVGVPQNSASRHVITVTTQSGDIRVTS